MMEATEGPASAMTATGISIGRTLLGAWFLVVGLCAATPASARRVLPPEAAERLVAALAPFGPGRAIDDRWLLHSIDLAHERVVLRLTAPGREAQLVLHPRDDAPALARTTSFCLRLDPADQEPSPDLRAAVKRLADRLLASDVGQFYIEVEERRGIAPTSSDAAAAPGEPAVGVAPPIQPPQGISGIQLLLLALLLAVLALMVTGREALARIGAPAAPRWADAGVPVLLWGAAFAFIAGLSPLSFLHENSHGAGMLELFDGLREPFRPMAGQAALQRTAALLSERTVSAVALTTALVASFQPPAVYALCRALGARVSSAAAAGALAATLPMFVRMSGSEDAFPAASAFLAGSAWAVAVAARARSWRWLFAAMLLVALAGHFRPVAYTAAAPIGLGALALASPEDRRRWLRSPFFYAAGAVFAVAIVDDLAPLFERLGEGTALTPGWWRAPNLRSLPILDPGATPPWLPPAAVAGLIAGLACRRRRAQTAWLAGVLMWLSFFYTADNGRPAALRYALSYAWILPVLGAIGIEVLAASRPRWGTPVAVGLGLLGLVGLATHGDFIGHRHAQQLELDFQLEHVSAELGTGPPADVISPWPELDQMSGTLLTTSLRRAGHRVVPLEGARAALDGRAGRRVYYFRSLACWARASSQARRAGDGLHPACAEVEAMARWRPVATRTLAPDSDADWIWLGNGAPVEVGLFRLER